MAQTGKPVIVASTKVEGSYVFEFTPFTDGRGRFQVGWERDQFEKAGIEFVPVSLNYSHNQKRGTLRGLHYQTEPYGQPKVVSCVKGKAFDVVVDMRSRSRTYLNWDFVYLSEEIGKSLYIPKGCAHGFLTLEDETVISYLIEGEYNPDSAATLRWNDKILKINWPAEIAVISRKDAEAPDFIL